MIGLEVASFMLAVFPKIISGLKHYKQGLRATKDWIRFRADYALFMNKSAQQKMFFRQNIENLLVASVGSDHDLLQMLEDPKHALWKDPKLEAGLRIRLSGPSEYECYILLVDEIFGRLEKLRRKLKTESDQSKPAKKKPGRFETEVKRFQYTLGKSRRQTLLEEVEKNNDDLQKLIGNSDMLETMRKKRSNNIPRVLEQIRSQAASLHSAVSRALRCSRTTSHSAGCGLFEENELDGHDIKTKVHRAIQVQSLFPPQIWRAWFHARQDTDLADDWYAAEAAMTVEIKPTRESLSISDTSSNTLTKSVSNEPATRARSVSIRDDSPVRRRLLGSIDSVTSALSLEPSTSSHSHEGTEIIDLGDALSKSHERRPSIGYIRDHEDRMHVLTESANSALQGSDIRKTATLVSLLEPDASRDELLAASSSSRRRRLNVALTMAKTLLRLYPGPLLRSGWSKYDNYFFQDHEGLVRTSHPIPILDVETAGKLRDHSPLGRCNAQLSRSSILSLGILVLEMWFNRSLESHPLRAQFLGSDGQDTEFTDFNTAQKWQEQALEEGGLELHNIPWRCIYCAFGAASQDFEDKRLRQAIQDEVVVGLEKILTSFG